MTMALLDDTTEEASLNGHIEQPVQEASGTDHTATVSLRVTFQFDNEFDYARKLVEVLGAAKALGDTELLNVDREAGNVRSERRGRDRDRIGTPRRRSPSAIARTAGDAAET